MRIAICDDEENIRMMLAEKLRNLIPAAEILLYSSGELLLMEPPPDILLLDGWPLI